MSDTVDEDKTIYPPDEPLIEQRTQAIRGEDGSLSEYRHSLARRKADKTHLVKQRLQPHFRYSIPPSSPPPETYPARSGKEQALLYIIEPGTIHQHPYPQIIILEQRKMLISSSLQHGRLPKHHHRMVHRTHLPLANLKIFFMLLRHFPHGKYI